MRLFTPLHLAYSLLVGLRREGLMTGRKLPRSVRQSSTLRLAVVLIDLSWGAVRRVKSRIWVSFRLPSGGDRSTGGIGFGLNRWSQICGSADFPGPGSHLWTVWGTWTLLSPSDWRSVILQLSPNVFTFLTTVPSGFMYSFRVMPS